MDDPSDPDDFTTIQENNFQKIQQKLTKVGYADGVADGRESVFQDSFDRGYADGLKTGLVLEKVKSFFANLTNKSLSESLSKEKAEFIAMNLSETSGKEHFQYLHHLEKTLNEVSEEQVKHLELLKTELKQKIPITMNLLE